MSQMRTRSGGGPRGMGPGGMMMGAPPARSKDALGATQKLIRRLGPEIPLLIASVIFTAVSVTLNVIGPKILGNATNIIFDGIVGKALPAGSTKQQAVALPASARTGDPSQRGVWSHQRLPRSRDRLHDAGPDPRPRRPGLPRRRVLPAGRRAT